MFNQGKQAVTMVTTTAWHKRKANHVWVEVLGMNRNDCQVKGRVQLLWHWIILEQNHRPSITFIASGLTISLVSSKLYALITSDRGTPDSFRYSLCPSLEIIRLSNHLWLWKTQYKTVYNNPSHCLRHSNPFTADAYVSKLRIFKYKWHTQTFVQIFFQKCSPSDNSRVSGSLHLELHKM